MKILITGSRNIIDTHKIFTILSKEISKGDIIIHGGIDPKVPLDLQKKEKLLGDRDLIRFAHDEDMLSRKVTPYKEIYVGHTSTWSFCKVPLNHGNLWDLDQGAGWAGKLSIMDIDTKEYWQSDKVKELYKDYGGR